MPLDPRDRRKLARILALLGSDQAGERSAAALKAHELVAGLGLDWADVLGATETGDRALVRRASEWDASQRAAAESRIRQLKSTAERQERQIRALRTRVANLTDRERKRRQDTDIIEEHPE